MPRVYYYRLRQQPATALADGADSALDYRGQQGMKVDADRTSQDEIPNQNQVFSLESDESDDFIEPPLTQQYAEERELLHLGEEVSQTASSATQWLQQAWALLLLTISHLFVASGGFACNVWSTRTFRYGILGALLVALLLYYLSQPMPPVVEVVPTGTKPDVVVMPGGTTTTVTYGDKLPLNFEIIVKRILEQLLDRRQDDILSRVMQKVSADKEELKRGILEDVRKDIDPKLIKMDSRLRSHLDAPAADESTAKQQEVKELDAKVTLGQQQLNDKISRLETLFRSRQSAADTAAAAATSVADDSLLQELQGHEARMESRLLRLQQEIQSGSDEAEETKRSLQSQIDTLQRRLSELTEQGKRVDEATRQLQEQKSAPMNDEQLREIVRLVHANQPAAGASSLSENQVREIIQRELEVFAADRVNMSDWALGAAGARILHAYTSDRYGVSLLGHFLGQVSEGPSALLTPSLVLGHCWAFPGERGNATVQLPCHIKPTAFSIDHVSRAVARDFRSAPQKFQVWGYADKAALADESRGVLLGDYRYDIYGSEVQTFAVQQPSSPSMSAEQSFSVMKLVVTANYGHEDFTCVYRFRVHGDAA